MLLLSTACLLRAPPELVQLTPHEFQEAVHSGEDVLLIDVHVPEQTHLSGTDALVPYDEVEEHVDEFPEDLDTPIYLYCRTGHMVNVAARTLLDEGHTSIFNLDGGTVAWEEAGLPY